ncbi:hypothetical protein LPJ53_003476 [Coemansia erecta]|uniref:Uncharacterized protein n=1 Tax=Coemansia erecta TaxID=147472 RepID=A0A9W7XW64_9FUNG|nr:hypothetical protein LPJ53_003476 [Coemansia erecta]
MDTNTMSAAESSVTPTSHITGADLDDFGLVDYQSPYLGPHDDGDEPAEEVTDAAVVANDDTGHLESEQKPDLSLLPEAPLSASASIYEGVNDLIDYEDSDVENADEGDGGADAEADAVADVNNKIDGDINDDNVVETEAKAEQDQEALIGGHDAEDIDGVYDYTDVHSVRSSSRSSSGHNDADVDLGLDLGLDQDLDDQQQEEQAEPSLDSGDAVIDLTDDTAAAAITQEWSVPDVWVYSEGEWLTYLGPGQSSYDPEMQLTLFMMPIDQLIEFLQSEIMLGVDTVVSLEFPSLELVIDQRIMQLVEETQQPQQHVTSDVVELNGSGEHDGSAVPNGKGKEHADDIVDLDGDEDEDDDEAGSTADLLADHDHDDEGEGEDEDDDFAPEDEDANDHKLDADALDGDDLEDEVQEEEDEAAPEAAASSNKRGSEHMSPSSDDPAEDDGEIAEPAAKKARSVTDEDADESADANGETVGAEAVAA